MVMPMSLLRLMVLSAVCVNKDKRKKKRKSLEESLTAYLPYVKMVRENGDAEGQTLLSITGNKEKAGWRKDDEAPI